MFISITVSHDSSVVYCCHKSNVIMACVLLQDAEILYRHSAAGQKSNVTNKWILSNRTVRVLKYSNKALKGIAESIWENFEHN